MQIRKLDNAAAQEKRNGVEHRDRGESQNEDMKETGNRNRVLQIKAEGVSRAEMRIYRAKVERRI